MNEYVINFTPDMSKPLFLKTYRSHETKEYIYVSKADYIYKKELDNKFRADLMRLEEVLKDIEQDIQILKKDKIRRTYE